MRSYSVGSGGEYEIVERHEHGNVEKGGDHVGIWHMAADRCIWIRADRGMGYAT